jgi:hypothetical protein
MIMFLEIPVISLFASDRKNLSLLRSCGYCQANRRDSEGQGLTRTHSHLLLQCLPDQRGAQSTHAVTVMVAASFFTILRQLQIGTCRTHAAPAYLVHALFGRKQTHARLTQQRRHV